MGWILLAASAAPIRLVVAVLPLCHLARPPLHPPPYPTGALPPPTIPFPILQAMGGVYSVLNQKRGMVFEEMQRPGAAGTKRLGWVVGWRGLDVWLPTATSSKLDQP